VQIFDPDNISVLDTSLTDGNVDCNDPFNAPLTNPIRYITTKSGAYEIRLNNQIRNELYRFDISITPDVVTNPDPTVAAGRLWAKQWGFYTHSFAEADATNADYFPLVPGGRSNTNYVWRLDLNNFSGNLYVLSANDLGVDAPNSGYSVLSAGNSVTPKFPIYVSYPAIANSRPTDPPVISDFRFIDNAAQDYAFTPGTTAGIQDSGNFEFTSDVDGTYSITIDTNKDGIFGTGDKLLLGNVTAGITAVVPWDGTDAAGAILSTGTYRAELQTRLGEYHFIADDAETSGGLVADGLTIYLANSDGSTIDTLVYWDDATFLGGTSTLPGGELSSTPAGKHTWGDFTGGGIGNQSYIDTYVYGLASAATSLAAISASDALLVGDDGIISVTPDQTAPGGSFSITVTDADLNTIVTVQESQIVVVSNPRTGEIEQISLAEASVNASDFIGNFTTVAESSAGINNDGSMNVQLGDVLTVTYFDQLDSLSVSVNQTADILITDGDNIPAVTDIDDDNDGIPDALEGNGVTDTDGDGIVDSLDLDSDNDGIFDLHESGANVAVLDSDNDGRIDVINIVGSNGLADAVETSVDSGSLNYNSGAPLNTDGDTVADFRDLDSDNDGIPDVIEAGGSDDDSDGVVGVGVPAVDSNGVPISGAGLIAPDTDGDNTSDQRDLDTDNDGIPDAVEGGNDTDGDGLPDNRDTDSDNDGVPDSVEAGVSGVDSDGDGIDDTYDVDQTGGEDVNGDGIDDALATGGDFDGDGFADVIDPDADGDGIPDVHENGSSGNDTDGDGIDDTFDVDQTVGVDANGDGIDDNATTPDSDGDAAPDYLDSDADNDGVPDAVEGGASGNDTDADGIDDAYDIDQTGGADANFDGIDDAVVDTDNDAIADSLDHDSDNDGLPDSVEAVTSGLDSDGDGIDDVFDVDRTGGVDANGDGIDDNADIDTDNDGTPDRQDLDSDDDGIPDVIEGNASGLDSDGDGIDDRFDVDQTGGADVNGDGVDDAVKVLDTDSDGIPDYLDIDSDNDGILDATEADTGTDTDGDGIDDMFDVDQTAGVDGNADGIDDNVAATDTDADGVPDYLDIDSDNDSIPDVREAGLVDDDQDGQLDAGEATTTTPQDSDGDITPDYRDTDSNNDGTYDIDDAGNGGFDSNGDGVVDDVTDGDGDGVPDVIDGDPGSFGLSNDNDGDGVSNTLDLDDDNDGIPDTAETDMNAMDIDTDGDGIADRIDLDSDNDGLPDSIEAVNGSVLDADADGVIDNFSDANGDGLDDRIDAAMIPLDSDGDSTADFRDLDSDNDGLKDLFEAAGFSDVLDVNNDGIVDNLADLDQDGFADLVDTALVGGVAGTALENPDTDADGDLNYRDTDSDNDGFDDLIENGDFDNNGVPDNLQKDSGLETAVRGIGSVAPLGSLLLLLLPALLRPKKMFSNLRLIVLFTLMLTAFSAAAESDVNYCGRHNLLDSDRDEDFNKCFYIGAGWLPATHVKPEGIASGWSTSDDSDAGYNIFAGWHFKPRWFVELGYADLGEAGLSNVNPSISGIENISYKIPSLHAGYYFLKPESQFNVYGKVGIATIQNEATTSLVPFDKQNSIGVSGGVGVQWRSQSSGLFARLAADFYDKDARSIAIMLGYYFGSTEKSSKKSAQYSAEPEVTPVPALAPVAVPVVASYDFDLDADGVIDGSDQCPGTRESIAVDEAGCSIFQVALQGVSFENNSAELKPGSEQVLDQAAQVIIASPGVRVEVQAHTDSVGSKKYNQNLSEKRASSVREYLISKGVSATQLESKGYGETDPVLSNETEDGRARNRRVELKVKRSPGPENN
jgi:outer membrane protein OmpA-like peptidoglycan-associated protein